jgi:hypothetical protein
VDPRDGLNMAAKREVSASARNLTPVFQPFTLLTELSWSFNHLNNNISREQTVSQNLGRNHNMW